jgi:hypothetical protein
MLERVPKRWFPVTWARTLAGSREVWKKEAMKAK